MGGIDGEAWKNKRILATAASGSVGTWLLQLGRLVDAQLIGTCGPTNVELVQSFGATEVLNYRIRSLKEWGQIHENKVDLVIDCVGGKSLQDAWWCVRDGGTVISIYQAPDQMRPANVTAQGVKAIFFIMKPRRSDLEAITKLVEAGKCRPLVDNVWPLEQFQAAFDRVRPCARKGGIGSDAECAPLITLRRHQG